MRLFDRATLAGKVNPNRVAAGITLVFFVLGVLYSVMVPSWEAPDEADHYKYAAFLRTQHELPVQGESGVATAHHPPLFYLIAAMVISPVDVSDGVGVYRFNPRFLFAANRAGTELNAHQQSTGDTFPYTSVAMALHLMRWLSLVFGAGAVWLTYKLAVELLPDHAFLACFAAALVAFNPQFIFISAGAMNDAMLACMATGLFLSLARAARQPNSWQRWFVVAIWTSFAALSKISGLAFLPLGDVFMAFYALRQRSMRQFIVNGLALALPRAILTGWWLLRNDVLYGDILGDGAWMRNFAEAIRRTPVNWQETAMQLLRSAWGVFGWMTVAAPNWYFSAITGMLAIAALGLIVYGGKQAARPAPNSPHSAWGAIGCVVLVIYQLALIVRENLLWVTATQGRYLFPVIAPAMILVSLGWTTLLELRWVRRFARSTVSLLGASLMALALYFPFVIIGPNFRLRNTLARSSAWTMPNRCQYNFGEQMSLIGYDVDTSKKGVLHLKLYWRALTAPHMNYSTFAHVVRATDMPDARLLGQTDQVPGTNIGYMVASWNKDDLILDERDIPLDAPLSAGDYGVRLGVYDYSSGVRLQIFAPTEPPKDYVLLEFSQAG